MIGLDETGLKIDTADQILADIDADIDAAASLGPDVNTGIDSPLGQLMRRLSSRLAAIQQSVESVVLAMDPNNAVGAQLDAIGRLTGTTRQGSLKSTGDGEIVGTPGTGLFVGLLVRNDRTSDEWEVTGTPSVILPGGTADVALTARTAGAHEYVAGDTWTIVTPIPGWTSFSTLDIEPDEIGRDRELDADYHERQKAALVSEGNDFDAIIAAVAQVAGVTYVSGYENKDCVNTVNDVPPGSFEIVVEGGDNVTIARAIYDRLPPGANAFGASLVSTTDLAGHSVTIGFTRPAAIPLYLRITIDTTGAEYSLPQNAEASVKAAVLARANELFSDPGVDTIANQLEVQVWANTADTRFGRPSIVSALVEVSDDGATWVNTYVLTHKQRGDFDSTRVSAVGF